MLRKLWREYVTIPRRLRQCADYGFEAKPELDALCERFDESLRNMWHVNAEAAGRYINGQLVDDGSTQVLLDELVAKQKAIQEEGGQELKDYLAPYFAIAERSQAGEWGKSNPPTIPEGWIRFRTAYNWRT